VRYRELAAVLALIPAWPSRAAAVEPGDSFVVRAARVFDGAEVIPRASLLAIAAVIVIARRTVLVTKGS